MRSVLIWGAGGGIGGATARLLTARGWQVFGVARRKEAAASLTPHAYAADVSDPADVERAVEEISLVAPDFSFWLYAVGDIASIRTGEMKPHEWRRILDANLSGAFNTYYFSRPLLADDAHLFLMGARSERVRLPGLAAYAAAKAGIEALATVLQMEEQGIAVTLVRPSAVATPLWRKVPFSLPSSALQPQEVAERLLQAYYNKERGNLDV